MKRKITKQARAELIEAVRHRYQRATKQEKAKILDEFVAVAGCHRKHGVRLLSQSHRPTSDSRGSGRRVYDAAVKEALIVVWEAADRICGKRLKAALPDLVCALDRHGHLNLDAPVRERLLSVSAAFVITVERNECVVKVFSGSPAWQSLRLSIRGMSLSERKSRE